MAIAHKLLVAVYHMLRTGTDFTDLGADYLDRTDERRTTRKLVQRLENLGYEVQITRKPPDFSARENRPAPAHLK
jgi:predicted AAA+ superfamily ATPase